VVSGRLWAACTGNGKRATMLLRRTMQESRLSLLPGTEDGAATCRAAQSRAQPPRSVWGSFNSNVTSAQRQPAVTGVIPTADQRCRAKPHDALTSTPPHPGVSPCIGSTTAQLQPSPSCHLKTAASAGSPVCGGAPLSLRRGEDANQHGSDAPHTAAVDQAHQTRSSAG